LTQSSDPNTFTTPQAAGGSDHPPAIPIAEAILARTLGAPVRLDAGTSLGGGSGRANVSRCAVLEGPVGAPASVIVKRVKVQADERYDPDAQEGPSVRLFTEWASLQFLSELSKVSQLAPRFYGGDRGAGVIVMEDLGSGSSLVQPLLGDGAAAAHDALEVYFRSLGRLNAITCGRQDHYWRIRDSLGPREALSQPTLEGERQKLDLQLKTLCEHAGVMPAPGTDEDVALVAALDVTPGPFLAFSQGDTCPDNCVRDGAWMRFFDFEWAWFRNAVSDGARARGNFPTCWCVNRLPDEVIRRCEAVYRAELARGCPAAADDALFYPALVKACAYWTLYSFEFYRAVWQVDNIWGIATERQRVLVRLELLAEATEQFGSLQALGATAHRAFERLRTMWPEAEPMPYYPAFRTQSVRSV
jgi:hypothetical protein